MSRYILSGEAQADLREIRDYIAEDSVRAARRVMPEFTSAFRGLALMRYKGHRREDLTSRQDVLFWSLFSYLIIYRPEKNKSIEVLAVLHGNRDVERLLRERLS